MSREKDEPWTKEPHEQDSFWAYLVVPEAEGFDLMAPTWLIDSIIADHEAASRVRELEAALRKIATSPVTQRAGGDWARNVAREVLARLRTNEAGATVPRPVS